MESDERENRRNSFGSVARDYAAFRPGYPAEAVRWLVGTTPGRVLELGCGTGKLTREILALGHDVVASDPLPDMLRHATKHVPGAHWALARAEDIPLPSVSVDVVVAGQSMHWFDQERALPEIARVLKPGGVLAMVWNMGDLKVPWVKRVFGLMNELGAHVGEDPIEGSDLFSTSEQTTIRHWQELQRESLVGFVASSSYAAVRTPTERDALLATVGELYDGYGRGRDGMRMPWISYCYRARVTGLANDSERAGPDDGLLVDFV